MPDFEKIYIYRMTHIENIPHIIQFGLTHRNSIRANPHYIPIGDCSLINTRSVRLLPNNQPIGNYIPFYFGYRTPMLYVIQKGFLNVPLTLAENIIYCVSSVKEILDSQIDFVFTDGHAIDSFTTPYASNQVNRIDEVLDYDAINARNWKDEHDLDKKRRKEAEFLLAQDLPYKHILGYICNNDKAKQTLIALGISERQIAIRPDYYF